MSSMWGLAEVQREVLTAMADQAASASYEREWSGTDLSYRIGRARSSTSSALNRLEEMGHVAGRGYEGRRWKITDQGMSKAGRIRGGGGSGAATSAAATRAGAVSWPAGQQPKDEYGSQCKTQSWAGWECNATRGHGGEHTAYSGSQVLDVWPSGGVSTSHSNRPSPLWNSSFGKQCTNKNDSTGYTCTARSGHAALHTKHTGGSGILATWSTSSGSVSGGASGGGTTSWAGVASDYRDGGTDICNEKSWTGWVCTAKSGHAESHTAHRGKGRVLEVWPKGSDRPQSGPQARAHETREECRDESPGGDVCNAKKGHPGLHTKHAGDGEKIKITWEGHSSGSAMSTPYSDRDILRNYSRTTGDRCPAKSPIGIRSSCCLRKGHDGPHAVTRGDGAEVRERWGEDAMDEDRWPVQSEQCRNQNPDRSSCKCTRKRGHSGTHVCKLELQKEPHTTWGGGGGAYREGDAVEITFTSRTTAEEVQRKLGGPYERGEHVWLYGSNELGVSAKTWMNFFKGNSEVYADRTYTRGRGWKLDLKGISPDRERYEGSGQCKAKKDPDDYGSNYCTLKHGHSGEHIAHSAGGRQLSTWRSEVVQHPDSSQWCRQSEGGFICTEKKGHSCEHHSVNYRGKLDRTWSSDSDYPPYEETMRNWCNTQTPTGSYVCSATRGHSGVHVAHDGRRGKPMETWPNTDSGDEYAPYVREISAWCNNHHPSRSLVCSAGKSHSGVHVAHDGSGTGRKPLATWPNDSGGPALEKLRVRLSDQCGQEHGKVPCTRERRHSGEHVATNSAGEEIARWGEEGRDDGELRVDYDYRCHEKEWRDGSSTGYKCTKRTGHTGEHVATGSSGTVYTRWGGPGERRSAGAQPKEEDSYRQCRDSSDSGYTCNARKGHGGQHTAYSYGEVAKIWRRGTANRYKCEYCRSDVLVADRKRHQAYELEKLDAHKPSGSIKARKYDERVAKSSYRAYHPRVCPARWDTIRECTCGEEAFGKGSLPYLEPGDEDKFGSRARKARVGTERKEYVVQK